MNNNDSGNTDINDVNCNPVTDSNVKLGRIFEYLSTEYESIYEIDAINGEYHQLFVSEDDKGQDLPERGRYTDWLNDKYLNFMKASFRDAFKKMANLERLTEALSHKNPRSFEFESEYSPGLWKKVVFNAYEYNKSGVPTKIIRYIKELDFDKNEQLRQQKALQDAYKFADIANNQKAELMARVSHDIRTPLNAIIGMSALAKYHIDSKERVIECLDKIDQSSQHLMMLINDLLDLNRLESVNVKLKKEDINLSELIDATSVIVSPLAAQKNHTLVLNTDEVENETIVSDFGRLQQILINVIGNAIKYTQDGGRIEVTIKENNMKEEEMSTFQIIVADNGIGMSEDYIKRIFDPFTRAMDSRSEGTGGSGLGMSIVLNLVRLFEGDIRVDSQLNEGTKITVTLPLQIRRRKENEECVFPGFKALMIFDRESSRDKTERIFRHFLMDVDIYDSIEQFSEHYDGGTTYSMALIQDKIAMENDYSAIAVLKQLLGNRSAVVVAVKGEFFSERKALSKGADGYIRLPIFKMNLLNKIKEMQNKTPMEKTSSTPLKENKYNNSRVLVVEDNEMNAEILVDILGIAGIKCDLVYNGMEAVDAVAFADDGYYDIIFMDINMPVLNGYEATKMIRNLNLEYAATVPIVALSANAYSSDVTKAKNAGMNDHLSKPIVFSKLDEVLYKYLKDKDNE